MNQNGNIWIAKKIEWKGFDFNKGVDMIGLHKKELDKKGLLVMHRTVKYYRKDILKEMLK